MREPSAESELPIGGVAEQWLVCASWSQKAAEDKGSKELQRGVSAALTRLQKLKAELAAQQEAAALE